jgi:hypothetical protein
VHNDFFLTIGRRKRRWPHTRILTAICERLYFCLGFGPLFALSQKYIPAAPRGINTASKAPVGNCGVTTPNELPQVDEDDDEDKVLVLDEVDFVD